MTAIEVTSFEVRDGSATAFQDAMTSASPILADQSGYLAHYFGRSIEQPDAFWLIVHWHDVEDHTVRFRTSPAFDRFVQMFRPFLATSATVQHFLPSAAGSSNAPEGGGR